MSLCHFIKVPTRRSNTSKFQMSTRPTKSMPADALTYPNSKTNLVARLHRTLRLRTSLMSRSATRQSLEAPTQQPAAASKPPPMYSPTHDYPVPTSTSTTSTYQSSPQPKIPFSTNPTRQHNAQSTTTPSDQIPIVSKVDSANNKEEIVCPISTFSVNEDSRSKIYYPEKSSI